jgi:hypothetical protein
VLSYVQAIGRQRTADELAVSLSGETEARLTFVLDTLHPDVLEDLLAQFDQRFPILSLSACRGR